MAVGANWGTVLGSVLLAVIGAFAALWAQGAPVNRGMRSALYATVLFVGLLVALIGVLGLVFPGTAPAWLLAPGIAICLPIWPSFRRAAARIMPIDPASTCHMIALTVVLLMLLFGLAKLTLDTGGAPAPAPVGAIEAMGGGLAQPGLSWAVIALFAVGLWLRRTWAAAVQRLGLVRPTMAQAAAGVATGLALGTLARAATALWPAVGPPDVLTQALLSQNGGVAGGLLVAVSIALGVDLFFYGALQPRIGLLVTALALLAVVFLPPLAPAHVALVVVAVALGLLRRWANTTTVLIAHTLANAVLMLGALG